MVFSLETQSLIVPKEDKEEYGEVATPYCVIENMLNLLPKDMFENPNLKWFDPCCGRGYFMEMIYNRLFHGLRECFINEMERRYHIMQNMLYMMDVQAKFKDELKEKGFVRVYTQNMFDSSFSLFFDVVVANPPYTIGGKMKVPTLQGIEKTNDGKAIWMKCIHHLMRNSLKEDGIALFITPVLWLRPDRFGHHASFFSEYSVDKLCIFNCSESFRLFEGRAQTPVCLFTLRNYDIGMDRHLVSIYDQIHDKYILWNTFRCGHVLPMCIPSIVQKIINKILHVGGGNCDKFMLSSIIHKTNMPSKHAKISNRKGVDYTYANVKTCTFGVASPDDAFTTGGVGNSVGGGNKGLPYRKTSLVINYSDRPCAYYGKPKMILAHKMYGMPYLDLSGEYGISNRDNYVVCMDDVFDIDDMYALKKWMKSPLVFAIMDTTRYRMRYLEKWAFHFIPNILKIQELDDGFPNIMNDSFQMDDIYKYFGFDEKECIYIKQFG